MPKFQAKSHTIKSSLWDLFSFRFTLEFIHYELTNFRNLPALDTTPEQEVNFLKAYFLIVDRVHEKYDDTFKHHITVDADSFRKNTWPLLIDQFDVDRRPLVKTITSQQASLEQINLAVKRGSDRPQLKDSAAGYNCSRCTVFTINANRSKTD